MWDEETLWEFFYAGYMSGVEDSEDYDHDPDERVEIAWENYLNEIKSD